MKKYLIMWALTVTLALTGIYVIGCETQGQSGALIGTGIGAGVGALAGGSTEGTLIGGAIGGGTGYIIGNEADKKQQKEQMRSMQGQMDSALVNIRNSNGSISQIRVNRSGTGWLGPRGEWYDHLPTEAELKPVYGF